MERQLVLTFGCMTVSRGDSGVSDYLICTGSVSEEAEEYVRVVQDMYERGVL